ncbi:MAG: helix-turn-helix transcriptional regulator [Clostridia bacterium]|nr:helix-turn-helix transcriptional regulator [Clostridia bacterium]
MVGGKWKLRILYFMAWREAIRYNELWRAVGSVTHNMLSRQLKEMEKDGLLVRKEYPQIPPKVEYSLSQKGWDLLPVFEVLCDWIEKYID